MKNPTRTLLASLPFLLLAACAPIETATVVETPPPAPAAAPETPLTEPPDAPADAGAPPLDAPIPPTPELRSGELDNGFRYYLRTNGRPEERAELRLVIDAGSVLEDEDQRGLAHFVEHMAFNGTRNFERQELVDYLESVGSRFGADLNAYTSFDETVYQLKVPTDDPEIVRQGFQILADWAHGITFDPAEIEKERGVIVEEWRLGRGASARIRDQLFPVLLRASRYAERLPIGAVEVIENAPHEAIRRFYHDWYRPDLMAVVAVGDFDPDRVEALIRQHFEPIPAAGSPRERPTFEVPEHGETLFSRITDPELSRTTVAVNYKHPAQPQGRYGDYRRSLVQSLYHGMLNARLDEVGQEADPPFLYAHSGMGGFVRSASVFSQQAAVRDGGVIRGLEALLTEVERVDRHGFTAGELERAKANVLRSYEQAYKERDKLDSGALADELVRRFLHGEAVPGIEAELELVRRFLPTIDLEEVNRQARRWITEENRVIVVTGPEQEEAPLPTEEELLAAFEAAEARDVEPYVDRVRDAPLVAEEPTPGEVVGESEIPELGVTEWRLSNGVRVVMKPTDFQNDQVLLSAWSPGGHSLVADEDYPTAVLAASIVGEGGLGAFDRIELGKALAGKVATAQAFISELEEGLSGFASPADLEILFQLVHLRFTAPRIDREAFAALLSKLRILVKNRDSRPQTVFNDRMTEILSQDHPRRRPMSEEMLARVDAQKALEIYRDRFADASDFTFVLAGNFDPEELREPVRRYLASLPATGREESWRDVGVRRPEGVEQFEVEKGLEPKSRVSLRFHGDAEWSREEQHRIASLAQLLQIRLRELLREEMGGTYGASVGGSIATRPVERYSVSVGFGCAPEEVEPLTAAVFEEIERLRAEPVDESYVHKLQEIQRRQRETDLEKNSFWVAALETYYSLGLDPRSILDHDRLVDGLTAEEMRRVARRYLDEDRYVLGVLYPEAAAAASSEDG